MTIEIDDTVFGTVMFFLVLLAIATIVTVNVRGCTERDNYQQHVEKMAATKPV